MYDGTTVEYDGGALAEMDEARLRAVEEIKGAVLAPRDPEEV